MSFYGLVVGNYYASYDALFEKSNEMAIKISFLLFSFYPYFFLS